MAYSIGNVHKVGHNNVAPFLILQPGYDDFDQFILFLHSQNKIYVSQDACKGTKNSL